MSADRIIYRNGKAVQTGIRRGGVGTSSFIPGGGVTVISQTQKQPMTPEEALAYELALSKKTSISPISATSLQAGLIEKAKTPIDTKIRDARRLINLQRRRLANELMLSGSIEALKTPTGKLESFSQKIEQERGIIRSRIIRGTATGKDQGKIAGLTALQSLVNTAIGIKQLPGTVATVVRKPSTLIGVPKALKKQAVDFNVLLQESPTEALTLIGSELVLLKGASKGISEISKGVATGRAFLPGGKGILKTGKDIIVESKEGKAIKLNVVNKIPTQSLAEQSRLAGKSVNAVTTIQDKLIGFLAKEGKKTKLFKDKQIIRKPIPGEEFLSENIKKALEKFDKGQLTKRQIIKLDEDIKKAGVKIGFDGKAKGLLERTFFADPTGKIRPSRTGLVQQKDANLLDILSGDVTFKKSRPQILVFANTKIANFPKALKDIGTKLNKGVELTKKEANKLINFQLKKTGEFKPVGFLTREREIILSPGETIKRVKNLGVTAFKGRSIPITQVEVVKLTQRTNNLLKDINKKLRSNKKPTSNEISKLSKALTKETGFKVKAKDVSSYIKPGKYVSVSNIISSTIPGLSKLFKGLSGKSKKTVISTIDRVRRKPIEDVYPSPVDKKPIGSPSPITIKKTGSGGGLISRSPSPTGKSPTSGTPVPPRPKPTSPSPKPKPRKPKKPIVYIPRRPPRTIYPPPKPPIKGTGTPPPIIIRRKPRTIKKSAILTTTKKRIKFKRRKLNPGYFVYEKRGKKFYKLKTKPLSIKDAKDKLAHRLDNYISRTAKIRQVGKFKKLGKLKANEKGYFAKTRSNLREYKIRKGRKIYTPLTYTEKKNKGLSTFGEKRQIALNRALKSRFKRTMTRPKARPKTVLKTRTKFKKSYKNLRSRPKIRRPSFKRSRRSIIRAI